MLGNAKGVVAAVISILVFRNPVTIQGGAGYAIALIGVALYSHVGSHFRPKEVCIYFFGKVLHGELLPTKR